MNKQSVITIKTGNCEDFLKRVKSIMRAVDQGEPIETSHAVIFEDPAEMLRFLSEAKLNLIRCIRQHPDSITQLAKAAKRSRAAVSRDIDALKRLGLVKTYQKDKRQTVVEMAVPVLKLEACI